MGGQLAHLVWLSLDQSPGFCPVRCGKLTMRRIESFFDLLAPARERNRVSFLLPPANRCDPSRAQNHATQCGTHTPSTPILPARARMKSNLSGPLPACQATSSAIVGVGVPPPWVTVQPTWERTEAEPQRICHIISMSACLRDRRSPSGSLWLSLSAQSHQAIVPTQSARIARAGQRPKCYIIDLSECLRT